MAPLPHLLPIISLESHSAGRTPSKLAQDVDTACRETGFLIIADHGLDVRALDRAFETSREFFALPDREKERSQPEQSARQRGYHAYETRGLAATLGVTAPLDMRESLFFGPLDDHLDYAAGLPASERAGAATVYAPNIVPQEPPGLGPAMETLYRQFEALTFRLLTIMGDALGAPPAYFTNKISRHFSILASHYYPVPPSPPLPGQLRTGAHTDFGAFTILAMREEAAANGGLEVRLADGQWAALSVPEEHLVVNLGDMMERWTNRRWVSTLHRVGAPLERQVSAPLERQVSAPLEQAAPRQSIGYFMHPDYDARIEAIPGLVDCAEGAQPTSITAGEHIREKIARSHTG